MSRGISAAVRQKTQVRASHLTFRCTNLGKRPLSPPINALAEQRTYACTNKMVTHADNDLLADTSTGQPCYQPVPRTEVETRGKLNNSHFQYLGALTGLRGCSAVTKTKK